MSRGGALRCEDPHHRAGGADRLASSPTVALSYAKWCVNRAMDVDRRISFGDEAIAQEAVMTSVDANEGVAAFVERRQPVYRGW